MSANSPGSFTSFFAAATGGQMPFEYQRRLAQGEDGGGGVSRLIDVPTGCGKTAAVVLAWLWNRVVHPDAAHRAKWPRRLVYCLPMRTLVEQTHAAVRTWLLRLARQQTKPRDGSALRWLALHSPYILMGGEKSDDWDTHPEADAILIGTQDMLLSRALNRGYGLSRSRWPMPFGLLHNDCLWVMDETQLMGVGVETSAQLEGCRARLGTAQTPCASWWMSATLDHARLATVDHPEPPDGWPRRMLDPADQNGAVRDRWEALKTLAPASGLRLAGPGDKDTKRYAKGGATARLLRYVKEGLAPGPLALAAQPPTHRQATDPSPGARRAQGPGQAARARTSRPL